MKMRPLWSVGSVVFFPLHLTLFLSTFPHPSLTVPSSYSTFRSSLAIVSWALPLLRGLDSPRTAGSNLDVFAQADLSIQSVGIFSEQGWSKEFGTWTMQSTAEDKASR